MKRTDSPKDKPLVWMHGEVTTPPFSRPARLQAGFLLRLLQKGKKIVMPHTRPLRSVGQRCHELRVPDDYRSWRIVYRIDVDAFVILEVVAKKTGKTPKWVIETCRSGLRECDHE